MRQWLGSHLTYANVMVTLLAFIVLGGGAYAAFHLPRNSVRSKHIVNGQVKKRDLAKPPPFQSAGLRAANAAVGCTSAPNQWAVYAPGPYGQVGYYRDLDGVVHLAGRATYCDPPSAVIFRLPPGYRPPKVEVQDALFGGGVLPIGLDGNTGDVTAFGLSTADVVGLDGITFRCGPSGKHGCP
jgi:hypothetical protein